MEYSEDPLDSKTSLPAFFRKILAPRLVTSFLVLLGITLLSLLGLYLEQQGRSGAPVGFIQSVINTTRLTGEYLFAHPREYLWHKYQVSSIQLIARLFFNSTVLITLSLGFAAILGVSLGVLAAYYRKRNLSPLILTVSIIGISTPSFLLAMLFWNLNSAIYRAFDLEKALLPATGFGLDVHLILPGLVLATRPLAQIMQITYVAVSEILEKDFMRVAKARGLTQYLLIVRHALRNVGNPILTTLSTSLRYSLASLAVVETFFNWPGIGQALVQAIENQMPFLVTDLIVSLGLLFILIHFCLEIIQPIVDPRLRELDKNEYQINTVDFRWQWSIIADPFRELLRKVTAPVNAFFERLSNKATASRKGSSSPARPQDEITKPLRILALLQPALPTGENAAEDTRQIKLPAAIVEDTQPTRITKQGAQPTFGGRKIRLAFPWPTRRTWRLVLTAFSNRPLWVGSVLLLVLASVVFFGDTLTSANPFETHGVMMVEGKIGSPPYPPSPVFPWGSDAIGRDIQALVLNGAKTTLSLTILGMMARMLLGTSLGFAAGWWSGSWLDRFISATIAVWAAFPATIFAMVLILGLGIQNGMSVFIIAICVIGWGEITQYIRSQVMYYKPQLFIEAAYSVGAGSRHILSSHILPNLLPSILVIAALECGSILMLLAELGFLNIFLGGGFKAAIAEGSRMQAIYYYFSDIPEWGALLANIRNWWRSYPWLAWYPGVFFFVAIFAFNIFGEGLRRFMDETRFSLRLLFNRYVAVAGVAFLLLGGVLYRSGSPLDVYTSQARQFSAQNAMRDIAELSSAQYQGRESGTEGYDLAAETIARRMEEVGLLPGGQQNTYIQENKAIQAHLNTIPILDVHWDASQTPESLVYRQDFMENSEILFRYSEGEGPVTGLAAGPGGGDSDTSPVRSPNSGLADKVIIVLEEDFERMTTPVTAGILVVAGDSEAMQQKDLYPSSALFLGRFQSSGPVFFITPETADRLLATAGSSISDLKNLGNSLAPYTTGLTEEGVKVSLEISGPEKWTPESLYNVIGYIPGSGAELKDSSGVNLDHKVIVVGAYYDGLGTGPDGSLYPGANDNASSVAAMLELARLIKEGAYQPKKTIVFTAWSGGERGEGLSVSNIMNAKTGFASLDVEAVIELSGAGGGEGDGIAIHPVSSYRLSTLFQDAAAKLGVPATTRGRSPHYGEDPPIGFGGRSAMTAFVSWDGSDLYAHTAGDTLEKIEADELQKIGETTALVLTLLGRETEY